MAVELKEHGISCSENTAAKMIYYQGLKARNGKRYKYFPGVLASDNLLKRNVKATRPNENWVSDITYIKLKKGYVYLAVITDLFSRKIIGWSLDTTMNNQLIIDALSMALKSRDVEPGLILHSDRDVQYRSGEYQQLLIGEGIRPSMSPKAIARQLLLRCTTSCIHAVVGQCSHGSLLLQVQSRSALRRGSEHQAGGLFLCI
jgi:putative transposase